MVRFGLRDASLLRAPLRVTYKYQTATGENKHEQTLRASDFTSGVASWVVNAPGLIRCNSVAVAYQ
jgi:hypothetical protein